MWTRPPLLLVLLALPLFAQAQQSTTVPGSDHTKDATDEEGHTSATTPTANLLQNSTEASKCDSSEDGDCKHNATSNSLMPNASTATPKFKKGFGGRPLGPLELGLTARSLSISALDFADNSSNADSYENSMVNHELKYRVFAQSWCSAANCPMALAATGSDMIVGPNTQEVASGKGEAVLVSKGTTNFGAVAVSILERAASFGVCAHAVSTAMPETSCAVVCWHNNVTCICSSVCTKAEVGSDSVLAYRYSVNPETGIKELLSYLHLLMVRFQGIVDYVNNAPSLNLNIPAKTMMIRERIERRFGAEKAKAVPVILV